MSGDRPWMKFYPRDWRGDQALRAISMAARGFWLECLCIMHEARPYGHLLLNGEAIGDDVLARMTGASSDEVSTWMTELRQAGVLSMTRGGVVYSRRMVRSDAKSLLSSVTRSHRRRLVDATGAISWRKAREYVIGRDGLSCRYCGDIDGPFDVDHVIPRSRGGSHSPSNLVVSCYHCNRSKSNKTLKEWRS